MLLARKSAKHSCVSSGTHQKDRPDTPAFLQERAQTICEALVRFFRNAPKKSARHSCVSSGTSQKSPQVTHPFLYKRAKKTAIHVGTRQKYSTSYSCVSSGKHTKNIRETLVRFFRNAPKKSARHPCVSSGTQQNNPEVSHAFLQERIKNLLDTRAFLQERTKQIREILARFFRNAHLLGYRC